MKRVISLWLPRFATDRLNRPNPGAPHPDPHQPLATVETVQGGQRLAAVNDAAEALGLAPAMPLATARALAPTISIHPADPEADLAMLDRLCVACERYTPWAALDPHGGGRGKGAGLWLDITGCDHLFGGEEALLNDVAARFARTGFRTRTAIAATPAAAWALARFGCTDRMRTLAGNERALLKPFPTAALRLDADLIEGLDRMGLRHIEDLVHLPRAPLARRFGRIVLDRLDQLFGDIAEQLSPRQAPSVHVVRRVFAEPIGRIEDIEHTLAALLPALAAGLESHGKGVRRLDLVLHRVDDSHATIEVGTSRPVRDPTHLARLFREKLAEVDPGFGIEVVVLAARVTEPLSHSQAALDSEAQTARADPAETARLVDRLANRLGPVNVTRLAAEQSHLPERACRERPANKRNKHPDRPHGMRHPAARHARCGCWASPCRSKWWPKSRTAPPRSSAGAGAATGW